jgi:hypothetical protein
MKTVASAFDDARGIVPGHRGRRMTRRGRLHSFLDVDQAEAAFFCLAFSYPEQYRKAQPLEGAAPFHPVCNNAGHGIVTETGSPGH